MRDGKHVILCIDDDQDFLDPMRMVLEHNGYLVETASSAAEAMERYDQIAPDCILVDLMMEKVDAGANFVKEVQDRCQGPVPPIYMLSSVGDSLASSIDYSQLGLCGVLQKPVPPQVLLTTISRSLEK